MCGVNALQLRRPSVAKFPEVVEIVRKRIANDNDYRS
jgi:hypothetical protein